MNVKFGQYVYDLKLLSKLMNGLPKTRPEFALQYFLNKIIFKIKIGTAQRFGCRLTGGFVNFLVNSLHIKLCSPQSTQLSICNGKIISVASP